MINELYEEVRKGIIADIKDDISKGDAYLRSAKQLKIEIFGLNIVFKHFDTEKEAAQFIHLFNQYGLDNLEECFFRLDALNFVEKIYYRYCKDKNMWDNLSEYWDVFIINCKRFMLKRTGEM